MLSNVPIATSITYFSTNSIAVDGILIAGEIKADRPVKAISM